MEDPIGQYLTSLPQAFRDGLAWKPSTKPQRHLGHLFDFWSNELGKGFRRCTIWCHQNLKNERFQRKIPPSNDSSLSISISMKDASESLPNFAVQVSHGQWWSRGIELPFTPKETSSRSGAVWKMFIPFAASIRSFPGLYIGVTSVYWLKLYVFWASHGQNMAKHLPCYDAPFLSHIEISWTSANDGKPLICHPKIISNSPKKATK